MCDKLEIPGYSEYYMDYFWNTLPCPTGMLFDTMYCECVFTLGVTPSMPFMMVPTVATTAPFTPSTYATTSVSQTDVPSRPSTTTTKTTMSAIPTATTARPTTSTTTPTISLTTTTSATTTVTSTSSMTTATSAKPKRRGMLKILFHMDILPPRETMPITKSPATAMSARQYTTPQRRVSVESGFLSHKSMCSGCIFEGGVGYKRHSSDCDKYVMCSRYGNQGDVKVAIRHCGLGEYWDQALLTCRSSTDVQCHTDKCRHRINAYTYSYHGDDCRAYWKCENGASVGLCCAKGYTYVHGIGCFRDPSCNTNCGVQQIIQPIVKACDKVPVPGNPRKFRQTLVGHGNVDMDCAVGTLFDQVTCDCQTDATVTRSPGTQYCKKELDLRFSNEAEDVSGKNVHVRSINVTYSNDSVCFQGNSVIVIPRFANAEIGSTLDIKTRFKRKGLIGNELQAIVYNGDCGVEPSIVVVANKDKILYSVRNKYNITKTLSIDLPVQAGRWMLGEFSLHDNRMSMTVEGRTETTFFFGDIDRSRCGLKLGWGKDYNSFVGCIDQMSISFCPKNAT